MGTQVAQFPDKPVLKFIPLSVDFADCLEVGETVNGISTSNSVFSGTDASPGTMLVGSPTYSGSVATQTVGYGIVGVIYNLIYYASTTAGNLYEKTGYVAVISDSGPY